MSLLNRILPPALWRFLLIGQLIIAGVEASQTERNLLGNEKATLNFNDAFSVEKSYRQSFCDEYQHMVNNSLNTAEALNGENVNVIFGTHSVQGLVNYDEETGIDPSNPGLYVNILDHIAKQANFTWRNNFGLITEHDANRSDTELLQWGTDNYDIFIGSWDVTSARINLGILFTSNLFDTDIIMVRNVAPPKIRIYWFNWLLPFEKDVWLVLVLTIIVSSFVFQFLEYIGKKRDDRSFRKWTMDNLYLGCINFTQNFTHEPLTFGGRIFAISFAFWAMLIGAAYTANLASLLVQESGSGFTLNTINDAIDNDMTICINTSTPTEEYVKRKYPQAIPLLVPRATGEEMYTSLINGECDLLLGEERMFNIYKSKKEFNPDCHLTWQGREVIDFDKSFATKMDPGEKCSLLVNGVMDFYIEEMTRDGTLEKLINDFISSQATRESCDADITESTNGTNRRQLQSGYSTSNDAGPPELVGADGQVFSVNESLTLEQMAGTFLLHLVLSAFAIIVGLLSWYEKKHKVGRHNNDNKNRHASTSQQEEFSQSNSIESSVQPQIDWLRSSHQEIQSSQKEVTRQMDVMLLMLKNIQDKLDSDDR